MFSQSMLNKQNQNCIQYMAINIICKYFINQIHMIKLDIILHIFQIFYPNYIIKNILYSFIYLLNMFYIINCIFNTPFLSYFISNPIHKIKHNGNYLSKTKNHLNMICIQIDSYNLCMGIHIIDIFYNHFHLHKYHQDNQLCIYLHKNSIMIGMIGMQSKMYIKYILKGIKDILFIEYLYHIICKYLEGIRLNIALYD